MISKHRMFPLCFEIGGDLPGGPTFKAQFIVHTATERITGFGHVNQAIKGFKAIDTEMKGNYTPMTVSPKKVNIVIAAHGYPPVTGPTISNTTTMLMPNADLRMVIAGDWKTGTANYKYMDSIGGWHEIKDAPVRLVDNPTREK